MPAVDWPFSAIENVDEPDLAQEPFSYDVYSLQLSSSDPSDLTVPVISPSNLPVSFLSSNMSHIPFPQLTDITNADPCLNAYQQVTSEHGFHKGTPMQTEIDQLKDMVRILQEKCDGASQSSALIDSLLKSYVYVRTPNMSKTYLCHVVIAPRQVYTSMIFATKFLKYLFSFKNLEIARKC
jgi:hypothetical protein